MSKINEVTLAEVWPIMQEQLKMGKSVRFGPKGTSMMPLIRQNVDTVMLKQAPEKLKKYDLPLYRRADGHFVLPRVVDIKPDGYVMCGDNQCDREFGVRQDMILAVAEGIYRKDKYISVNNISYKIYVRYWVLKKRILSQKLVRLKKIKLFFKKVLTKGKR